ncbi:MAG: hypothetical protein ABS935_03105 [Solibacillus sp.]|uniref:hypothetical protein n=1 Tax=Solibacillus sp. TaxID=1909654 RepID=UPI0033151D67
MIKNIAEWFILIWSSLLVLLVTGWILVEFYEWKDTIIAAIIAFVGAIIGGLITWLGVRITIDNANKIRNLDAIPEKIERINRFYNSLVSIQDVMFVKFEGLNRTYSTANNVLKYIEQNKLVTESMLISETIYKDFQDLIMYAQKAMNENLKLDDCFNAYSNLQEELKVKIDKLKTTLDSEAKNTTEYYFKE